MPQRAAEKYTFLGEALSYPTRQIRALKAVKRPLNFLLFRYRLGYWTFYKLKNVDKLHTSQALYYTCLTGSLFFSGGLWRPFFLFLSCSLLSFFHSTQKKCIRSEGKNFAIPFQNSQTVRFVGLDRDWERGGERRLAFKQQGNVFQVSLQN